MSASKSDLPNSGFKPNDIYREFNLIDHFQIHFCFKDKIPGKFRGFFGSGDSPPYGGSNLLTLMILETFLMLFKDLFLKFPTSPGF